MCCLNCGRVSIFPARCGARTCSTCARRAWLIVIERAEERLALFDMLLVGQRYEGPGSPQKLGYKLLTLTTRTPYSREDRFNVEGLCERVSVMRHWFRKFWRKTDWGRQVRDLTTGSKRSRRDTAFILALEIGPSGNVHLHVLVHGEFLPQALLQSLWSEVVGELAIVDVREARSRRGALQYVLKYLLKGAGGQRPRPQQAAAVESALRRVRRVEMGGALRRACTAPSVVSGGEPASAVEAAEVRRGACENCGEVGSWLWRGRIAPSEVMALGGLGLLPEGPGGAIALPAGPDPTEEERRAQREGA